PHDADVSPTDSKWGAGRGYAIACCAVPAILLAITWANLSMQDEPLADHARKRFGPDAYYKQTGRLIGSWWPIHFADGLDEMVTREGPFPLTRLTFDPFRNVTASLPSGEEAAEHRWSLMNQYIWLDWHDPTLGQARTPLEFRGRHLLIAWPPGDGREGFLVFEKRDE
ncbi:MAG: hypothetical protein QG656_537, partial [Candidatus Hydrogenedentes bacterium]|nr:hypothetical protein [Candidatus Hydrogenedentota bacterium]